MIHDRIVWVRLEILSMAKWRPTFPAIVQNRARPLRSLRRRRYEIAAQPRAYVVLLATYAAGGLVH